MIQPVSNSYDEVVSSYQERVNRPQYTFTLPMERGDGTILNEVEEDELK